jgi:citrate lyase synthetase
MLDTREYFAATLSNEGRVVVTGGRAGDQVTTMATAEAYDADSTLTELLALP